MPFLATPSRVVRALRRGIGTVDHLGIDAGLYGFEDVAAGQVDGGGRFPVEVDFGTMGDDQRLDDAPHVPLRRENGLRRRSSRYWEGPPGPP